MFPLHNLARKELTAPKRQFQKYPVCFTQVRLIAKFVHTRWGKIQQGKSEGFDSCNRPSNLIQIEFESSIFQPVWP